MHDLGEDTANVAILLFLYVLQGIPLGLAAAVPLILANRHVSYKQQATFSFATWPFSMKLLWAPIVDACFVARFGRRKTWLVPVQYLIGFTLLGLCTSVDEYLDAAEPDMIALTGLFFALNFLAATQDIAVDGWALTMLQRKNVGYASTCNSVGQTAGYFLGYVGYMALESHGLVTLSGFLGFWGVVFLVATTFVAMLKHEKEDSDSEHHDLGVLDTYSLLWKIVRLPLMPVTILFFLTGKIGFSAADAVTGLKLIEMGVPKDQLALLAIPMIPLQIVLPIVISRYTAGPRPMDIWVKSVAPRLFLGMVLAGIVYITPGFRLEDGSFPFFYYAMIVGIYAVHQVTVYSMFVSQMAWFAKISDPAVGGTYMTLLNTVTNLGGNWPATLALWAVDPLTSRQCLDDKGQVSASNVCGNAAESEACRAQGGTCNTSVEGFYVESWICCVVGLLWLVWGWKTARRLQSAEESKWLVVKKNSR